MNPATAERAPSSRRTRASSDERLGLSIQVVEARTPDQFEAAFDAMGRERAEGVLVLADATFWTHRARLHELVAKRRLPSIWGGRDWLDGGGLASYQSDFRAIFRRAAAMVDAIAKGAKPARHAVRAGDQARARRQPEVGEGARHRGAVSRCSSPPTT